MSKIPARNGDTVAEESMQNGNVNGSSRKRYLASALLAELENIQMLVKVSKQQLKLTRFYYE